MAGGPINISIASDTRQFQAGIDDVADSLQQVTKELDQATSAGDRAGTTIDDAMEQAQRGARGTAEAAEAASQSWSSYGRAAQQAGEKASAVGSATRKAGDDVKEGGKVGEAALMNLSYSAGTVGQAFSGPGGALDSIGQFAAFLGPALGPVAGSVVTLAGLGLSALGQQMANTASDAANASPAVKDFISQFQDGTAAADSFDQALRDWSKDATDFGGQSISTVADAAERAGVNFGEIADAITSKSIPAMAAQERSLDDLKQKYNDERAATEGSSLADANKRIKLGEQLTAIDTLNQSLGTQINNVKQAAAAERVEAEQMGLTVSQYRDYGQVLQTASDDHVTLTKAQKDQVAATIAAGGSAKALKKDISDYAAQVKASKDAQDSWNSTVQGSFSSAASASTDWAQNTKVNLGQVAQNLNETADQVERLPGDINTALTDGLSQTGLKFLESLPNGQQIIDQIGLNPGSPDAQKLIAAANRAGTDAGKGLSDGLTKVPPIQFKVTADTKGVDADLDKTASKKRTTKVTAEADTKEADSKLDSYKGKVYTPVIKPAVDTSAAESALQRWLNKPRSINVTVNQRPGTRVI